MPRVYSVSTEAVSVSAAQDLMQIKGASGKMLRILRVKVGATDTTAPTNQQLDLKAQFLPATVTDGSGGSSPTPRPKDPGDSAASFTAKANNTTPATSNGTATVVGVWGVNVFAGLDDELARPVYIGPSESFTLGLMGAPTGTLHLSTEVEVEETGG